MGNVDFYVILATENSNKFQKIRFWKGKSVDDDVTSVEWVSQIFLSIIQVSLEHHPGIPIRSPQGMTVSDILTENRTIDFHLCEN